MACNKRIVVSLDPKELVECFNQPSSGAQWEGYYGRVRTAFFKRTADIRGENGLVCVDKANDRLTVTFRYSDRKGYETAIKGLRSVQGVKSAWLVKSCEAPRI